MVHAVITDDKGEAIRTLAAQGKSDPEIARALDLKTNTVNKWRLRKGVPSQWVPERKHTPWARPYCRCAECRKARAIAARADSVANAFITTGGGAQGARWTAEDDAFIVQNKKHMTRVEMALALGRSLTAVRQRIWKLGKDGTL